MEAEESERTRLVEQSDWSNRRAMVMFERQLCLFITEEGERICMRIWGNICTLTPTRLLANSPERDKTRLDQTHNA